MPILYRIITIIVVYSRDLVKQLSTSFEINLDTYEILKDKGRC